MDKNSIKKNLVKYHNFARELPIKDKQIIMDEQKKENRMYYGKIIIIVLAGILLSFIGAKTIRKNVKENTLLSQGV